MSDQDFFFDEDEPTTEKPAAKPASKSAAKPTGDTKAPASAPRAKAAPAGAQSVTMTVAALIGVVALLVGIIIGIVIPTGATQPAAPIGGMPPGMGTGEQARPLSPEELEGGMPPGHPEIGGTDDGAGMMPPAGEDTETAAPEGEGE